MFMMYICSISDTTLASDSTTQILQMRIQPASASTHGCAPIRPHTPSPPRVIDLPRVQA
ncbi:hypothetical protein C8Q80DRAFT_1193260 [Daedaleopsis nitida]|nr:hypothetical protein C8Q80DRAFT_1193260 [Daedaleopsis nitida]